VNWKDVLVFASKDFKLFFDLFRSLRQLLGSTATRGPLEEVLKPSVWSAELLNRPVTDLMTTSFVVICESAAIAVGGQGAEGESSEYAGGDR
jgi:hypothetical protein